MKIRKIKYKSEIQGTDAVKFCYVNLMFKSEEIVCLFNLSCCVDRMSEDRGWELMWLVTGCFAPSTTLLREITLFLRSRHRNQIAHDCTQRLQKTLR